MRISISSLAWDPEDDEPVAALLRAHGVDAIDLVPGKYFPDPGSAAPASVADVRRWWSGHGVEIVGMQALLAGTAGLNVFGDAAVQDRLLAHLASVCRIARGLGATRLVFGSPRNRDRSGLSDGVVEEIAVSFFRRLGDLAESEGLVICLEPNPAAYGANFMTTTDEAAAVVRMVGHPAIRLQLDVGAITMNAEDIETVVAAHTGLIGHVHASEPSLVPVGDGGSDHLRAGQVLARSDVDAVIALEMLPPGGPHRVETIGRALQHTIACYRLPADRASVPGRLRPL